MDDVGSEDENSQQSSIGSSHRGFKSQLDRALTARQEAEAKVTTLEEKVKQFEAENVDLKQKVTTASLIIACCCSCYPPLNLIQRTGGDHRGGRAQPR